MLKFEAVRAKSIEERTRLRASINVVSRYGGLAVFSQKWCSRLVRRRNIAEGKEGRRKTYWSMDVIFFLRSICGKNLCLYPRAVPKKRPTLRRELQLTTAGAHKQLARPMAEWQTGHRKSRLAFLRAFPSSRTDVPVLLLKTAYQWVKEAVGVHLIMRKYGVMQL